MTKQNIVAASLTLLAGLVIASPAGAQQAPSQSTLRAQAQQDNMSMQLTPQELRRREQQRQQQIKEWNQATPQQKQRWEQQHQQWLQQWARMTPAQQQQWFRQHRPPRS